LIDRQHGKVIVECDSCDAVLDTEQFEFTDARQVMQREGWRIRKIAEVWLHGCPKCGVPT
jgi:predicted RNA-binding Zn-ribbon protein involved in translation (DUF1610 family)